MDAWIKSGHDGTKWSKWVALIEAWEVTTVASRSEPHH
jgi:hypothetical protein